MENGVDDDMMRPSSRDAKGKGECRVVAAAARPNDRNSLGRERDEPSFIGESSFVRAPLNSRVSLSPAMAGSKGKARADSLDRVPVDIQEALILEDLLYVLMVRCLPPIRYLHSLRRMTGYSWNLHYLPCGLVPGGRRSATRSAFRGCTVFR